jgi:hypothetical protein
VEAPGEGLALVCADSEQARIAVERTKARPSCFRIVMGIPFQRKNLIVARKLCFQNWLGVTFGADKGFRTVMVGSGWWPSVAKARCFVGS